MTPTTYSEDPVLAAIERFMCENENITVSPLCLHKGKLYDTDSELLEVLASNNQTMNNRNNTNTKSAATSSKRKLPRTTDPSSRKQLQVVGRPRGRPAKKISPVLKWAREVFEAPKFCIGRKLGQVIRTKRKAERCTHCGRKAVILVPDIRKDAQTVRSIVVKKEIIDLTDEEEIKCYMSIKFGKQHVIGEETVEVVNLLVTGTVVTTEQFGKAEITEPDVRIDLNEQLVDLTGDSDEEPSCVATSEKECAKRILPLICKFHKVYYAHRRVEDAFLEFRSLAPEEDDVEVLKFILNRTKSIGQTLVTTLSNCFIKNINLERFLDIISLKLAQEYRLKVDGRTIGFYLFFMLKENQQSQRVPLARKILDELEQYLRTPEIKKGSLLDDYEMEVVFTELQLLQLQFQIEKFHDICRRQEEIMQLNCVTGQSVLVESAYFERKIKEELLNLQMRSFVKRESDVGIIDISED